jgi:N6-L-threonylcarbamoyladenine synthase
MIVLGIETSCDETAAAIVDDTVDDGGAAFGGRILSNRVLSQIEQHRPYGGVVPEIAARAHVEHIDRLVREALDEAGCGLADLDAIAATAGPGLIGGVMVGLVTAKTLALGAGKPLVAVNHLEGHALTVRLGHDVAFPFLLLLVSGGHCQLLLVEAVGRYRRLGGTIDDAIGEAFDKTAKMLGLPYPGGPAVEALAKSGDASKLTLPRPLRGRAGCDFSFSGLKTAVRQVLLQAEKPNPADVAAAFQAATGDVLVDRTRNAIAMARAALAQDGTPQFEHLVVAGGVAANQFLRARLQQLADAENLQLLAPPVDLCTDNGAMIAWAGLERARLGLSDPLDFPARARWPLDPGPLDPGTVAV